MEIDEVDFSILKVLSDSGRPLWKKKLHNLLKERLEELPGVDDISVQTVGRRVDSLHDKGLLESCIISPEDINRDLIIAYKLTDEGRDSIVSKRDEILRNCVIRSGGFLLGSSDEIDEDRTVLAELIADQFGLDEETKETVLEEYSTQDIITLLGVYYAKKNIGALMNEENLEQFTELALENKELADAFATDIINERVKKKLRDAHSENN